MILVVFMSVYCNDVSDCDGDVMYVDEVVPEFPMMRLRRFQALSSPAYIHLTQVLTIDHSSRILKQIFIAF